MVDESERLAQYTMYSYMEMRRLHEAYSKSAITSTEQSQSLKESSLYISRLNVQIESLHAGFTNILGQLNILNQNFVTFSSTMLAASKIISESIKSISVSSPPPPPPISAQNPFVPTSIPTLTKTGKISRAKSATRIVSPDDEEETQVIGPIAPAAPPAPSLPSAFDLLSKDMMDAFGDSSKGNSHVIPTGSSSLPPPPVPPPPTPKRHAIGTWGYALENAGLKTPQEKWGGIKTDPTDPKSKTRGGVKNALGSWYDDQVQYFDKFGYYSKQSVAKGLKFTGDLMGKAAHGVGNTMKTGLAMGIKGMAMEALMQPFTRFFQGFSTMFEPFNDLWEAFGEKLSSQLMPAMEPLIDAFVNFIDKVALSEGAIDAVSFGVNILAWALNGLSDIIGIFSPKIDPVITGANGMFEAFGTLTSPMSAFSKDMSILGDDLDETGSKMNPLKLKLSDLQSASLDTETGLVKLKNGTTLSKDEFAKLQAELAKTEKASESMGGKFAGLGSLMNGVSLTKIAEGISGMAAVLTKAIKDQITYDNFKTAFDVLPAILVDAMQASMTLKKDLFASPINSWLDDIKDAIDTAINGYGKTEVEMKSSVIVKR